MSAKLPYPMAMLQSGRSHDPFALLGLHRTGERPVVRTFMPQAESVELDGFGAMARIPNTDIFEILLSEEQLAELLPIVAARTVEAGRYLTDIELSVIFKSKTSE